MEHETYGYASNYGENMSNYFSWEIKEFARDLKESRENEKFFDEKLGFYAARAVRMLERGETIPLTLQRTINEYDEALLMAQLRTERLEELLLANGGAKYV